MNGHLRRGPLKASLSTHEAKYYCLFSCHNKSRCGLFEFFLYVLTIFSAKLLSASLSVLYNSLVDSLVSHPDHERDSWIWPGPSDNRSWQTTLHPVDPDALHYRQSLWKPQPHPSIRVQQPYPSLCSPCLGRAIGMSVGCVLSLGVHLLGLSGWQGWPCPSGKATGEEWAGLCHVPAGDNSWASWDSLVSCWLCRYVLYW